MVEFSLCMIVKNEENNLGKCLASVDGVFDEIVIVDTGSTDRTKEIAVCYGCKLYDFEWIDDFAAARNFSFSKATKEYIMWLDADDLILPESKAELLKLKDTLSPSVDFVIMKYHTTFKENGEVAEFIYRERLLRRDKNFVWESPVHESITVSGIQLISEVIVTHTGKSSHSDTYFKILEYEAHKQDCNPRILYYYGSSLMLRNRYEDAIEWLNRFVSRLGEDNSFFMPTCIALHFCHIELKDYQSALDSLLKYLSQPEGRSEIYCQLGYFAVKILQDVDTAIGWFEHAVNCKVPESSFAQVMTDFYYFVPYFELGNCYVRKMQHQDALKYYELALRYCPSNADALSMYRKTVELLSRTKTNM